MPWKKTSFLEELSELFGSSLEVVRIRVQIHDTPTVLLAAPVLEHLVKLKVSEYIEAAHSVEIMTQEM